VLVLTATPAAGQRFVHWTGVCGGEETRCSVLADGVTRVGAVFAPARLALTVSRTGEGAVTSTTSGAIVCGGRCGARVKSYAPVTLRATPRKGWRFRRWTGACRGPGLTCTVPMTAAAKVGAVFVRR
jgi:hypothetical protein